MGRKRRRFIADYDDGVELSAGVFSHSRASDERALDGIHHQGRKRRRAGLNTRFDQMIGSMNTLHQPSSTVGSSRARSSSISSYGAPRTPADAYSDQNQNRPGKTFRQEAPVSLSPSDDYRTFGLDMLPSETLPNDEPLPPWLADTFLTLDKGHPLRSLLPDEYQSPVVLKQPLSTQNVGKPLCPAKSPIVQSPAARPIETEGEVVFAFQPPDESRTVNTTSQNSSVFPTELPISSIELGAPLAPTLGRYLPYENTPGLPLSHEAHCSHDFTPFAKPGPCSTLLVDAPPPPLMLPLLDTFPTTGAHMSWSPRHSPQPVPRPPSAFSHSRSQNDATNQGHASAGYSDNTWFAPTSCPPAHAHTESQDDCQEEYTVVNTYSPGDSSDPPGPSSDTLTNLQSNLYSTPGPGYYGYNPVYFDSPAEDPSNSDPLDPSDYKLDWADLDFRWKPFMRDHERIPHREAAEKSIYVRPDSAQFAREEENADAPVLHSIPPSVVANTFRVPTEFHTDETSNVLMEEHAVSYDLFVQELDIPHTPVKSQILGAISRLPVDSSPLPPPNTQAPSVKSRSTPEIAAGPVFAPAPGIYISPLREPENTSLATYHAFEYNTDWCERVEIGREPSNSSSNISSAEVPITSSQASIESIESWNDTYP